MVAAAAAGGCVFIVSSTGSHWKVEGNDPVRVLKDDLRHGKLQFSLPQVRK